MNKGWGGGGASEVPAMLLIRVVVWVGVAQICFITTLKVYTELYILFSIYTNFIINQVDLKAM